MNSLQIQSTFLFLSLLVVSAVVVNGAKHSQTGNGSSSESWGYVQVRPKAHMFWWLYRSPYKVSSSTKQSWPTILWLQGGPGGSGVAIGNFEEVGPLDTDLKPRNSTWLRMADLLFVDNPVGTGYSFVEDEKLYVKTDEEAAADLTTLLISLFNKDAELQNSPLYIVAESYGGKYAVTLGLSALKAIEDGRLKMKLGGIALGDSWISPEDFVVIGLKFPVYEAKYLTDTSLERGVKYFIFCKASWGPLLKDLSRIDYPGLQKSNSVVQKIRQQIAVGQFRESTDSWSELEDIISKSSNSVDFYNFLRDSGVDDASSSSLTTDIEISLEEPHGMKSMKKYSAYLSSLRSAPDDNKGGIDSLMNGVIKKKLKLPASVIWGSQSEQVFNALQGDFMKPRINEVDQLLAKGVSVTVYNGQVDLICATKGTQAWVDKLKWGGLKTFLTTPRTPLYCGGHGVTKGFTKSYKNLRFYWILGAGHFVPVDQPCVALKMIGAITNSPAIGQV